MTLHSPPLTPCLGFLTVVENAELGFLGGYLLLNAAGRPLEFHCTAPIRPNRTQEILYGPTLRPFLYGEQIGQTLLAKSKLRPVVVCTDSEPVLAVRDVVDLPVVYVVGDAAGELSRDAGLRFQLASNDVMAAPGHAGDREQIRAEWPGQADHLNLLEPFDRIREALDEAQRAGRQAA